MRKIFKIIGFIVLIIAIPFLIDVWIFGNTFPSNIDNQTWASFLGGYLGGIATLVAVRSSRFFFMQIGDGACIEQDSSILIFLLFVSHCSIL